ncbi:MAG: copper-binding protein [Gordonia sp. (in: high G+C Gram-positive bacteria)]|uniref:copper-binding protein n=1 Tax=Gordonia sp. (in: high G+C Gram-positive bacteria) TaxID=84139 RepID=UPI003BB492F9
MSAFTRTTRRIASGAAISALGIAVALGTTACGAGKISQTNNMEAGINGGNGTLKLTQVDQQGNQAVTPGSIGVRNLQIMYPVDKAAEVFGAGGPFKLVFTIANDSTVRKVQLTGITAEQGKVEFLTTAADGTVSRSASPGTGGALEPSGVLSGGLPSHADPTDGVKRLDVELSGTGTTVAAGLTVPLTLHFDIYDLAGNKIGSDSLTIATPVDTSAIDGSVDVVRDAQPEHSEGGGH